MPLYRSVTDQVHLCAQLHYSQLFSSSHYARISLWTLLPLGSLDEHVP